MNRIVKRHLPVAELPKDWRNGLPADAREYAAAAAILEDLGLDEVRLLTNNPDKIAQLSANGITVLSRVPLLVGQQASNRGYLQAKRDRMGHDLPGLPALLDENSEGGLAESLAELDEVEAPILPPAASGETL